ncbi:kelch domain-containing protein 7A isoform X2 [Python bivittatus]|uniref:Kelch domain-containing protein 7A isoform X1 n=1 Tax=Python bivittatus TaxID=176946 RepID=A0A9F5MUV0_PYTBI|nr:kelch domain-containing protein 7A isoform X1 [Python bivittatus]XP_025019868.1 kelch domain-containing protein 7A isoform X2 [Python bivittatus]
MTHRAEGSGVQPSEMPLAGRLALSAAALLLLMLAYRYYKSRVSPGTTGAHAADASAGAEQREWQARSRMENEAAPGLRHRGGRSRKTEPCCPGTNQLPQVGRRGVAEERGQAWKPAGRELRAPREAEAEEKQEAGHVSHLETGLQGEEQGGMSEDGTKERFCAIQSCGSKVGADSGDSGSSFRALDLLHPEGEPCGSYGSQMGPGWDVASVEAESSCAKTVEREAHPTDGSETGLRRGQGPEKDRRGQVEESQYGQERIQAFCATSDMGLSIHQRHVQSHVAYAFSSVAKVQVEENFIKERNPKEQNPAQDTHLRGKVYDYYVQSTSQSIMNKNTLATNLDPQQSCPLSATNILNVSKECLAEEPVHSSGTENEADKLILEKVPDVSSNVLLSPAKAIPPEDERGVVAVEEAIFPKPSVARRSLSRKESFHKIVDNPEFQVPMEGFGSPAMGPSSGDTLPPALLHSDSASSLVQNLQSTRREEPVVELVAGAKFFHVPLSSESCLDVRLDLGNCYEVLCMAKKQQLKDLQEAAYKVMSDNYLQVLKTQAIYRQLNAAERDLILQKRMQGKKYMTVADISSHASRLCYYDDQKDTWFPLTHIPVEAISRACAICSMFNYLFVVAGCKGHGWHQKPSNRVFCYNPLTNIWQEICPLNQARPHCKLVALDGCLYAIGGECLYTVERYDPRLDRWTFAAPLPNDTFAVAHTATVCDGEICVTGGTLRYMLLRYVGRTDTWKVSLTGGSQDRTTEMVSVDGFIYRFDLNQRMGISVYRCSAKAKLWYECATHPMPFPPCFQCAVIGNLVYCVNRQFNIRFLADLVSPRFGTKKLENFPSPRGTLIPVILTLPEGDTAPQTRV